MKLSSPASAALTQAEHWLQILAETSPAAIFVFRESLLYVNPAALALTGYEEKELLGRSFAELLAEGEEIRNEPAARGGGAAAPSVLLRLIRRDGEMRWIRCQSGYLEMDWQPATLVSAIDVTDQLRIQAELAKTRQRLDLAQRVAHWITWEWEPETDRLRTSEQADALFGLEVEKLVRTGDGFLTLVHPDDRDRLRRAAARVLQDGRDLALEIRCITPHGEVRWLSQNGVGVRDGRGRVRRVVGVAHDITERKIAENALFQEIDRAHVTLSSIADGVIRTDARGAVDYLNPVAQRLTGWSLAEAYGQPASRIYQVFDEESGKRALDPIHHCLGEQREQVFLGHRLLRRRDGSHYPIHDSAAPLRDRHGRLSGAILVFRDLTLMRELEERMRHLESHDPLTGLINRRQLELLVFETLRSERGQQARHVLCHLSLDGFKPARDTCGRAAGDQLIRQIAGLLQHHTRRQDLVARLGAEEFAILFRNCSQKQAEVRAREICDAIRRFRFHWHGRTFASHVSAGLAPMTAEVSEPGKLMGAADAACFVARQAGNGRLHVFQPGDTAIAERFGEMQWPPRLQRALDENRFCLWYQTIRPLRAGLPEPPLSELFIRLTDEDGRVIAPGAFLPAAERFGLIAAIDRWVVRSALRLMVNGVSASRRSQPRFAINISGHSLGATSFLDEISEQIESARIAPNRLLFEITESSAIANLTSAMRFISVLKEMGCLFVLDNFGQAPSSFGYLKNLPLDFLKIDGGFVRGMTEDPIQTALVASIRDIGEVMGLCTIAESVENSETYEALSRLGVDYVQGYYLHRPQPLTTVPVGRRDSPRSS